MADVLVVDCTGDSTATRPPTADEQAVAAADANHYLTVTAPAEAARTARIQDASDALTQLIAQAGGTANVRAKLKAVLAGTDTLTPAQVQRLLAAVALAEIRDRSDT